MNKAEKVYQVQIVGGSEMDQVHNAISHHAGFIMASRIRMSNAACSKCLVYFRVSDEHGQCRSKPYGFDEDFPEVTANSWCGCFIAKEPQ